MDIRPGELIFTKDECPRLATMLSRYLRRPKAVLSAADDKALREIWARVSDMSILSLITSGRDLLFESSLHRERVITPQEITSGAIAVPRSRALIEVIGWAAEEFVAGSPTHTGAVGSILNSDYEDHAIPRALGSTNESLAHCHAESLLAAGQVAAAWVAQLDQ